VAGQHLRAGGQVLDLSPAAFAAVLGPLNRGIGEVTYRAAV
jgi:hypothetical protein